MHFTHMASQPEKSVALHTECSIAHSMSVHPFHLSPYSHLIDLASVDGPFFHLEYDNRSLSLTCVIAMEYDVSLPWSMITDNSFLCHCHGVCQTIPFFSVSLSWSIMMTDSYLVCVMCSGRFAPYFCRILLGVGCPRPLCCIQMLCPSYANAHRYVCIIIESSTW